MKGERQERLRHGRSFGAVAPAYARLRPGYPAELVGFLLGGQRQKVLDLGAGTGKLSEAIIAAAHQLVAVDPDGQMLAELSTRHPDIVTAVGTAEAIPLANGAVDAVVVGQAAHWFELALAAPEIGRVLRSGGVVGLVWNLRDERVPWVAALMQLLDDTHAGLEVDGIAESLAELLGRAVQRAEFSYVHALPLELMVDSLATRSQVVLLEPAERKRLLEAARELFATHPETVGREVIEHPYRTFVYKLTV